METQMYMKPKVAIFLKTLISLLAISYHSSFATIQKIKTNSKNKSIIHQPDLDPLKEMHAKYKDVKALAAEFSQLQKNATDGSIKESSGRIYIKRPNMFRWETLTPEASILVGNGHKVWYYTPPFRKGENGQVLTKRAADVQSQLAVDLLSGRSDPKKDFNVSPLTENNLSLKPLKPLGNIEHIELYIERSTKLVYKLKLFTTTGNETVLTLKNLILSASLNDQMFNFIPPEGTEEIK